GRSNPLNKSQSKKALYLLQQVRDEAHRFAINFQRKRREQRAQLSVLDTIPGISPKKIKVLLKHFKGITRMKTASIDEIAVLSGMNKPLAKALIHTLNAKD
ncbi:MAG: excinuclease ABC subunit C, partial [Desulfobacula sp.]|nr:excinuclease ABC subunit C [Desulfobacula sp.]